MNTQDIVCSIRPFQAMRKLSGEARMTPARARTGSATRRRKCKGHRMPGGRVFLGRTSRGTLAGVGCGGQSFVTVRFETLPGAQHQPDGTAQGIDQRMSFRPLSSKLRFDCRATVNPPSGRPASHPAGDWTRHGIVPLFLTRSRPAGEPGSTRRRSSAHRRRKPLIPRKLSAPDDARGAIG